jgi:hypothetical protein
MLLLAVAMGCSKPATTGTVTGTVKLDGVPLKSGQIRFVPVDGQSPTAGAVITDGQYRAPVSFGEKSVEITSPREGAARRCTMQLTTPPPADAGGELIRARTTPGRS